MGTLSRIAQVKGTVECDGHDTIQVKGESKETGTIEVKLSKTTPQHVFTLITRMEHKTAQNFLEILGQMDQDFFNQIGKIYQRAEAPSLALTNTASIPLHARELTSRPNIFSIIFQPLCNLKDQATAHLQALLGWSDRPTKNEVEHILQLWENVSSKEGCEIRQMMVDSIKGNLDRFSDHEKLAVDSLLGKHQFWLDQDLKKVYGNPEEVTPEPARTAAPEPFRNANINATRGISKARLVVAGAFALFGTLCIATVAMSCYQPEFLRYIATSIQVDSLLTQIGLLDVPAPVIDPTPAFSYFNPSTWWG